MYNSWYILCVLCRLAVGSSKHVEAINRSKLKESSASCWSSFADHRTVIGRFVLIDRKFIICFHITFYIPAN
jgi:hypothetical protein